MVYVVSLRTDELDRIDADLTIAQRFTKALPAEIPLGDSGLRLALVLSTTTARQAAAHNVSEPDDRQIAWMGVGPAIEYRRAGRQEHYH